MKKPQSLSRARTRLSRSASASSVRKDGCSASVLAILGATLLLVSLFFLQARLGGFGSHRPAADDDVGLEISDSLDGGHKSGALKIFGKNSALDAANRKLKLPLPTDLDSQNANDLRIEHGDDDREALDSLETDDEETEADDSVKISDDEDDGIAEDASDENSGAAEAEDADEVDEFSQQEYGFNEAEETEDATKSSVNASSSGGETKPKPVEKQTLTEGSALNKLQADAKLSSWERVFGVIKMPLQSNGSLTSKKLGTRSSSDEADPQSEGVASFSSDDEPMERSIRKRLEEVTTMEDALMVRRGVDKPTNGKTTGTTTSPKVTGPKKVFDTEFERKVVKPPFEPWNPTGSSLLQDPDSIGPSALTKSDKAIFKALRRASEKSYFETQNEEVPLGQARKELLESSGDGSSKPEDKSKGVRRRRRAKGDRLKWGYYPGLDEMLSFSEFMDQFLGPKECELNVFMAWNSPPWAFTVRHQRGLESLLHFHPRACVTFFSETVELDFLNKFVQKGYRVAVVRPNLEELLEGTPADVFANIWLKWRKVELFHIHYSELLRLAALYKYGGVYLDSDVIVLKPLDGLRNALGEEVLADGTSRLNGAVMAFVKDSAFIGECLDEYAATYDDKLVDWNGADLLTRVASNATWNQTQLQVLPSSSFFPFSASNITSYFSRLTAGNREEQMLKAIEATAYTVHLWNRRTGAFVPENRSLVSRILDRHCKWCDELV